MSRPPKRIRLGANAISSPAPTEGVATTSPTPTTTADSAQTATKPSKNTTENLRIVLAVPDARLAELIGSKVGCWVVGTGADVEVVVIVARPSDMGTAKVAAYLANAGHPEGITEFPEIRLGYYLPEKSE